MAVVTDTMRAALTAEHLAHLVTINADGSPRVSIVWIGLDDDEIVSGHLGHRRKLDNVWRDPRVTLSLETGGWSRPAWPITSWSTAGHASAKAAAPSCSSAWPGCTWAKACASRPWTTHLPVWSCMSPRTESPAWALGVSTLLDG